MVEEAGETRPAGVTAARASAAGWGGSIATAVGVAAAVGAAQLGLGYGLDVISWRPGADGLSTEAWLASLAWATWIAATSTIAGAVVAERLAAARSALTPPEPPAPPEPPGPPPPGADAPVAKEPAAPPPEPEPAAEDRVSRGLWRLVLAAAAALGATATVALSAIPARVAEPAEIASPQAVAAGYAVLGVLVGLVVAVGALAARAVAANLIATASWLWLLAVVAVVDGVLAGRDWERVPLAFWMFTDTDPGERWGITAGGEQWFGNIFLPDAGLAAGAALVIGALAALPAARRGDHPVGVVVSGALGPLVVAAAYLLAQPDLVGAGAVDISRHLIAPYLVVTGLLGSLLVSAVRPRTTRAPAAPEPDGGPGELRVPAARGEAEPVGSGARARAD